MAWSRTRGDDLSRGILLDDYIKLLQKTRDDVGNIPVGRTGHFGEYNAIDKYDVGVRFDTSKGGWEGRVAEWVEIETPDIGPDPD